MGYLRTTTTTTTTEVTPPTKERDLSFLEDVSLCISVELGRVTMSIRKLLALEPGSIIELGAESGEPLEVHVNGRAVARAEVVSVNNHYGIRVTEVLDPEEKSGGR